MERIHSSFPRIKCEKFLPCRCDTCKGRSEPGTYPLSELRDFAEQKDLIQCRVSRKLVDAGALIRDVFPSAALAPEAQAMPDGLLGQERCPAVDTSPRKEVFVSYAWVPKSKAVVDRLQAALKERGIPMIRDRNEMRYKDSIRDFMRRIGRGKAIVVVVSEAYLKSKSCMFELTEIAEKGEIRDRVFPIILDDARIDDAGGRLDYIAHWECKTKELNTKLKKVSGAHLEGIREELDLYDKIRGTVAKIMDVLGDMNMQTLKKHESERFEELARALEARLST